MNRRFQGFRPRAWPNPQVSPPCRRASKHVDFAWKNNQNPWANWTKRLKKTIERHWEKWHLYINTKEMNSLPTFFLTYLLTCFLTNLLTFFLTYQRQNIAPTAWHKSHSTNSIFTSNHAAKVISMTTLCLSNGNSTVAFDCIGQPRQEAVESKDAKRL